MKTITLTDEKAEQLRGTLNASKIRIKSWIKEARAKAKVTNLHKELHGLEAMLREKEELEADILKQLDE